MTRKITPQVESLAAGSCLDLFAGCGGLSLGLARAGWHGVLAIEKESFAFGTLKHNLIDGMQRQYYDWPEWFPKSRCSIGTFIGKYEPYLQGLRGKVTLIAGGPPCQGFSIAGKRNEDDPRNKLVHDYIEVVKQVQPALLLLENVKGIGIEFSRSKSRPSGSSEGQADNKARHSSIPYSERIARKLKKLGYHVYANVLNAANFGVAQSRQRYFLIAVHTSVLADPNTLDPFSMIDKVRLTFLQSKNLPVDRPIGSSEALSDLQSSGKQLVKCVDAARALQIPYEGPTNNYQQLLHGNMNGTPPNSLRLPKHREKAVKRNQQILEICRPGVRLSDTERKALGISRRCIVALDPSSPTPTLTTVPDDILHYSEPRILTVREYARLQSFPDWFDFLGNYTTGGERRRKECPRYTQVANAVPPFVAEVIGLALQEVNCLLKTTTCK